jgi:hypothetical protein
VLHHVPPELSRCPDDADFHAPHPTRASARRRDQHAAFTRVRIRASRKSRENCCQRRPGGRQKRSGHARFAGARASRRRRHRDFAECPEPRRCRSPPACDSRSARCVSCASGLPFRSQVILGVVGRWCRTACFGLLTFSAAGCGALFPVLHDDYIHPRNEPRDTLIAPNSQASAKPVTGDRIPEWSAFQRLTIRGKQVMLLTEPGAAASADIDAPEGP